MDLRRMRYFVVVAEELHFGRAAARLNVVQPAISQQIRLLEEALGVILLDRSSRKVTLTESGRIYLDEARLALTQVDQATRAAREAADGTTGRLRIGFVDNAIWWRLPQVIRAFRAEFPRVELDLRQLTRSPQVAGLRSGELDIGILPAPITQTGMMIEPLARAALQVVLPEGHRLCQCDIVMMSALAKEPFVSFASAEDPRRIDEIILSICAASGFTPTLGQAVHQMHTALALVSAGFGVAMVPPWIQRAWSEGVVFRPLDNSPDYELVLATAQDRPRPTISAFVGVARRFADVAVSAVA